MSPEDAKLDANWFLRLQGYCESPGSRTLPWDWLHPHQTVEPEPTTRTSGYYQYVALTLDGLSRTMQLRFLLVAADMAFHVVRQEADPDYLEVWQYARDVAEARLLRKPPQLWPAPPAPHPQGRSPEVLLTSLSSSPKWLELMAEGMRLISTWNLEARSWRTGHAQETLRAFGLGSWLYLWNEPERFPTTYDAVYVGWSDNYRQQQLRMAMWWVISSFLPEWRALAHCRYPIRDVMNDPEIR